MLTALPTREIREHLSRSLRLRTGGPQLPGADRVGEHQFPFDIAARKSECAGLRFHLREPRFGPAHFLVKQGKLPHLDERSEPSDLIRSKTVARPLKHHVRNPAELADHQIRRMARRA